jgi:predicted RNA binding protein YcfA (HicA-like mRNA interferase family)
MESWGEIISVLCHGSKAVKKGTLSSIIKDAGLTVDEFEELL